MAIRWGLSPIAVPPAPFQAIAVDASWHVSAPTLARRGMVGPSGTDSQSSAVLDIPVTETVTTNPYNMCAVQYISPPLVGQNVSAGSTFSAAYQCWASSGAANATPRAVVRLFDLTGAYKATLFSGSISSSGYSTAARMNTALAVALTAYNADDGDRFVVELGHEHANAVATSYTSTLRIAPMPANASQMAFTQGATTGTSWVEFSTSLDMMNEADVYALWTETLGAAGPVDSRISGVWAEAFGVQLPVQAAVSTTWVEVFGLQKPVEAALTASWVEVLGIAGEPPPEGPPGIPNVAGTGRLYVQHEGVWYPLPAIAGVVT